MNLKKLLIKSKLNTLILSTIKLLSYLFEQRNPQKELKIYWYHKTLNTNMNRPHNILFKKIKKEQKPSNEHMVKQKSNNVTIIYIPM